MTSLLRLHQIPTRRLWVCARCLLKKLPQGPTSFAAKGTTNIERHLNNAHRISGPSGKRLPKGITNKKRPIAQFFELDANDGKEQVFINTLKDHFDKNAFQSLLLAWITESNAAFRAVEAIRLRHLLDYLNPSISLTQAHMTHDHSVEAFRGIRLRVLQGRRSASLSKDPLLHRKASAVRALFRINNANSFKTSSKKTRSTETSIGKTHASPCPDSNA